MTTIFPTKFSQKSLRFPHTQKLHFEGNLDYRIKMFVKTLFVGAICAVMKVVFHYAKKFSRKFHIIKFQKTDTGHNKAKIFAFTTVCLLACATYIVYSLYKNELPINPLKERTTPIVASLISTKTLLFLAGTVSAFSLFLFLRKRFLKNKRKNPPSFSISIPNPPMQKSWTICQPQRIAAKNDEGSSLESPFVRELRRIHNNFLTQALRYKSGQELPLRNYQLSEEERDYQKPYWVPGSEQSAINSAFLNQARRMRPFDDSREISLALAYMRALQIQDEQ